ncbi:MAG: DNA adenine methylase [archaeon]|nr:DNA adenine methylase [archaeon]
MNRYFEPFVGGGSTFFNMCISNSFINDLSKDLMNLYVYVKESNPVFIDTLRTLNELWKNAFLGTDLGGYLNVLNIKTNYKRHYAALVERKIELLGMYKKLGITLDSISEQCAIETARKGAIFNSIRDLYNLHEDNPQHVAFFFFMREYCYSGMFRFSKNNSFNVPYGGLSYNKKSLDKKINYMLSGEVIDYLKNTTIENMDFENFLRKYEPDNGDFVFLDPPYDSDFSTYDGNSFGVSEQKRLHKVLSRSKTRWMLLIKKTDFIKDLYMGFPQIEYDKNYLVSFKNRNNKRARHLLIVNYEANINDGTG